MKKLIPYIPAVCITLLWFILQYHVGGRCGNLVFGLSSALMLLLFLKAWEIGQNPDKPLYGAFLLSLAGLLVPALRELVLRARLDYGVISSVLLFILLILPACIVGYFTRQQSFSVPFKCLLNGLPGLLFLAVGFGVILGSPTPLSNIFFYGKPLIFVAVVIFLSAFTEAQTNSTELRRVRWDTWRLLVLLEMTFDMRYSFSWYVYSIYSSLLQLSMPLLLWNWKKWLEEKAQSRTTEDLTYFAGAFVLNILVAEGHWLVRTSYLSVYTEMLALGSILTLIVYWQKPVRMTSVGLVSSIVFLIANCWLALAVQERLCEIITNLAVAIVNLNVSNCAEWLAYHLNTTKAFISGDLSSLYAFYAPMGKQGFMHMATKTAIPYAFPLTLAIVILTVLTAVLLLKRLTNHSLAIVFASSMILQALFFAVEKTAMLVGGVCPAFSTVYVAEYVLMWWLLRAKPQDS